MFFEQEPEARATVESDVRALIAEQPRAVLEAMIVEYCARQHPNVILVRNPHFRTTTTAKSYAIGSKHVKGKCIYVDGDTIVEPSTMSLFLSQSSRVDTLVGVTETTSENAVLVGTTVSPDGDESLTREVKSFSRQHGDLEWANIFSGSSEILADADGFVYEALEAHLPLRCMNLSMCEIDTANDLELAKQFVATIDEDTT